jgi:hypothetical protein
MGGIDTIYELQFDLACDVGLKYSPRQFSSRILYWLDTNLRRVYDKSIIPTKMAKTVKLTKMAYNGYPPPPNCFRFRGVNSYQPSKGGYYWLSNGEKGAQGHLLSPNCQRACEEVGINCQRACEEARIYNTTAA